MKMLLLLLIVLLIAPAAAQDVTYNEAPMLAEQVAAGDLPPIAERLPVNPVVVDGDEIGVYGGTWRRVANGLNDVWNIGRTFGYEPLVRWAPDWSGVIPGVAEGWEVADEGSTFIFRLREGMKWSDGMPFTSADIMFWYEDVAMNRELNSSPPALLMLAGEAATVTAPDEYTVIFNFTQPNGLFLRNLAFPDSLIVTLYARHYFEQFHPRYNPDVAAEATASGFENWMQEFVRKGGAIGSVGRWNPEMPVLYAWMPAELATPDTSVMRFVRNPYFWKVDSAGNQYPYMDYVNITIFQDQETMLLEAAAGNIDMQKRHIGNFAGTNKAFLFDEQERGNFHFFTAISENNNAAIFRFNLNHEDPVMREILQNKEFRIGLSHAINRQEIIDVMYIGQGAPHQVAPLPSSPYYHERLATQYTEFDLDLANQYLDEAGYAERDADGFRLGPDGNRISFVLMAVDSFREQADIIEIVASYWRAVGIEVLPRLLDRATFEARAGINDFDVIAYPGHAGIDVLGNPNNYLPISGNSFESLRWSAWYNGDQRTLGDVLEAAPEGTEDSVESDENEAFAQDPRDELIYRQWELWDLIKVTPDEELQHAYVMEMLDIAAERFANIGISTPPDGFGIVRNDIANVPETTFSSWTFASPGPVNTFAFFKRS